MLPHHHRSRPTPADAAERRTATRGRTRTRRSIAILAIAALIAVMPTTAAAQQDASRFGDVADGAFYTVPVVQLDAGGVFAGTECDNGSGFCPDEPLDRQTMAVWVVRLSSRDDPAPISESRFDDVDAGSFYAPFIERMAERGITTGCGDGSGFCPDATVTRAQMAVFLSRAYRLADAADPEFADVAADAWYATDVAKLAASGITQGCGDGTVFCPEQDTTRGEMATFLYRAVTRLQPEPEPVESISEPLSRCTHPGYFGSGRTAVLVGIAGEGIYSPVVEGGPNSCVRIMLWWDALRQVEAERIASGQYPCQYQSAYLAITANPEPGVQSMSNGPPIYVGCWPEFHVFFSEVPDPDPVAETRRLHTTRYTKLPPNFPAWVEALYGCYKMALEGPPHRGWESPWADRGGYWPSVLRCHSVLQVFGRPMRELGLDPACAAEQYTKRTETFLVRPQEFDEQNAYADEFSWVNCPTAVSRLVGDPTAPFAQQCEAVVDSSAAESAIAATLPARADDYGLNVADFLSEWKAIVCHGSKQELRTATINGIDIHGDLLARWSPPEGAICYEAVMLAVARAFIREHTRIRVLFC